MAKKPKVPGRGEEYTPSDKFKKWQKEGEKTGVKKVKKRIGSGQMPESKIEINYAKETKKLINQKFKIDPDVKKLVSHESQRQEMDVIIERELRSGKTNQDAWSEVIDKVIVPAFMERVVGLINNSELYFKNNPERRVEIRNSVSYYFKQNDPVQKVWAQIGHELIDIVKKIKRYEKMMIELNIGSIDENDEQQIEKSVLAYVADLIHEHWVIPPVISHVSEFLGFDVLDNILIVLRGIFKDRIVAVKKGKETPKQAEKVMIKRTKEVFDSFMPK